MPTASAEVTPHKKHILKEPWFWVIIVGIILVVIGIIIRVIQKKSTELFWITISLGALLVFIGLILLVVWTSHPTKQAKIEKMATETSAQHLMNTYSPMIPVQA